MPAARSQKLRQLLDQARRSSEQAHRAYVRAENTLTEAEDRDAREAARQGRRV